MNLIVPIPLHFAAKAANVALWIHPVVVRGDSGLILIDCGYPGFLPILEKTFEQNGLSFADVRQVLITHHDHDHMGALAEILEKYPSVEALCSAEQLPYVTGKEKSLRLQQAEALQVSLPESARESGQLFMEMLLSVRPAAQARAVAPGEQISRAGGVEIVDTQGHMPGHLSVYVRDEKTLIAGDALVITAGRLSLAMPEYTLNIQQALRSVERLLGYDIEKIICYHGGEFDGDARSALRAIVSGSVY